MPPIPPLKNAWEHRALILAVVVVALLAVAKRQQETIAALRARPTVEYRDRIVEKRVVLKGPVRIVKEVMKGPDGTETTRTITDRAPETITADKYIEKERTETPPQTPKAPRRTRYVGLSLDPFNSGMPRRFRAGVTLWDIMDAGAAWEQRRSINDGALQVELTYRF